MTKNQKIWLWIAIVAATSIGGTFAYFGIRRSQIRKCLDEQYNDPSSDEAAGGSDKLLVSGAFNRNAYTQSNKATITKVEARERSKEVWDNYSYWFGSDQEAIIQAFSGLEHIDDVRKMSYEFYQSYGEELLTTVKNALGDSSPKMSILIGIINQLDQS